MAERKKPVKKVNKKNSSPELSAVSLPSSKNNNALQIEDLIKQAFLQFYNTANLTKSKAKDLEHLNLIMEEYLKCFMVLGYDLNGEKICLMNAHTSSEKDALIEHLRSTLVGILNQ
jgi:hypothetical protein